MEKNCKLRVVSYKWALFIFLTYNSLFITHNCFAQAQPKLVVGIVVDQMRYDYLYRFSEKYGKGGFKRLMNEGFLCKNAQYT